MKQADLRSTIITLLIFHLFLFVHAARGEGRTIDFSAPSSTREVNQYYSLYVHGQTRKTFVFLEQKASAILTLDPKSPDLAPSIEIQVYSADEPSDRIVSTMENVGSDALTPDAAKVVRRFNVEPERIHTKRGDILGHERGRGGDEYDRYMVAVSVEEFSDGDVTIRAGSTTAELFVQTRDLGR
jgi:hypothetical protein